MCTCESISPGIAVVPPASIMTSHASTAAAGAVPTDTMRSSSVRMVSPASSGSSKSPDTIEPTFTMAMRIYRSSGRSFRQPTGANEAHQLARPPLRLMVERGRRPRVSNHEAAEGPAADPSAFALRTTADKSRRPAEALAKAGPQDEVGASAGVAYRETMVPRLLTALFLALVASAPLRADPIADVLASGPRVAAFLDALWADASKRGITRATFDQALGGFTPDARVIAATQREPEYVKPVGVYVD